MPSQIENKHCQLVNKHTWHRWAGPRVWIWWIGSASPATPGAIRSQIWVFEPASKPDPPSLQRPHRPRTLKIHLLYRTPRPHRQSQRRNPTNPNDRRRRPTRPRRQGHHQQELLNEKKERYSEKCKIHDTIPRIGKETLYLKKQQHRTSGDRITLINWHLRLRALICHAWQTISD